MISPGGSWKHLGSIPEFNWSEISIAASVIAFVFKKIKGGVFDDWICALLNERGGKWRVVKYVIGATDVAYEGWDKEFDAPPDIFR